MQTAHLREREAAQYLNVGVGTLRKWRKEGRAPAWTRIPGGRIRYPLARLEEFLDERTIEPSHGTDPEIDQTETVRRWE